MKKLFGFLAIPALVGVSVVGLVDAQSAPTTYREYTVAGATTNQYVVVRPGTNCLERRSGSPTGTVQRVLVPTGASFASCTPPPTTTIPPATTVPPTTSPPTTVPPTTAPPTTVPPTTTPPSGSYIQDFSDPNAASTLQWQLHTFGGFSSWSGDHDLMCGDANTSRTVNLPGGDGINRPLGDTVYSCRDHLMTSYNGEGYAQLDFSPNRTFNNISRVCWDQNMTDMGDRKWTQMVVVPEATYQSNGQRLDYIEPGFEGPGANGIFPLPSQTFMLKLLRGSTQTYVGSNVKDENFLGFLTSDKTRRYKTCVTDLNNGTVRIELERNTTTEVRIQSGRLPDGQVRVIFQDVNYNPPKSGARSFTWHWDNLIVS